MEIVYNTEAGCTVLNKIYLEDIDKTISINAYISGTSEMGFKTSIISNYKKIFSLPEKDVIRIMKSLISRCDSYVAITFDRLDYAEMMKRNFDVMFVIIIPTSTLTRDYYVLIRNTSEFFNSDSLKIVEENGLEVNFIKQPIPEEKRKFKSKPSVLQARRDANIFSTGANPPAEVRHNVAAQREIDRRAEAALNPLDLETVVRNNDDDIEGEYIGGLDEPTDEDEVDYDRIARPFEDYLAHAGYQVINTNVTTEEPSGQVLVEDYYQFVNAPSGVSENGETPYMRAVRIMRERTRMREAEILRQGLMDYEPDQNLPI